MINFVPRTAADLTRITTPAAEPGGTLEGYKKTYYDTAAVPTGSTAAPFFTVPRAAPFATNLDNPGSGQLPRDTWFSIHSIHVTMLAADTNGSDPEQWEDVAALILSGNGRLTLTVENKRYGPWRIAEAGSIGGVDGRGFNIAAVLAEAREYGQPGPVKMGIHLGGSIWLVPNASFGVLLEWENPGVVLSATRDVGLDMVGDVWRPVT